MVKSDLKKLIPIYIFLALAVLLLVTVLLFSNEVSDPAIPAQMGSFATYEIINRYPHDPDAYTQGLVFSDGVFYESIGLYRKSSLRVVDPPTGDILHEIRLPSEYFAEGLALHEEILYQLTWREHTGFTYRLPNLTLEGSFTYPSEGWGLTSDGTHLILSNGSNQLTFYDPENFTSVWMVAVTWNNTPLNRLHELEYIEGSVYANIYMTDKIARIDPETGEVLTMIDMSGLMPEENAAIQGEILNGIAYDSQTGRLFVTGKHWAWMYEIRLIGFDSR